MTETQVEKHFTVAEAAALAGMSASTIKRAIEATEGHTLRAKVKPSRVPSPKRRTYTIPASWLAEFLEGLDNA
jgi:hypothetical protein